MVAYITFETVLGISANKICLQKGDLVNTVGQGGSSDPPDPPLPVYGPDLKWPQTSTKIWLSSTSSMNDWLIELGFMRYQAEIET